MLAAAFLVARSCGSSQGDVTKERAIEIARKEVSFRPDGTQVRNIGKGIPQRRYWAVSFYTGEPTAPDRYTVVEVDAETGKVTGVARRRRP